MPHTPFPLGNPTQVYKHKGWGFLVPRSYPCTARLLVRWFPAALLQLGDLVYPSALQLLQWTFPLTNLHVSDTNFQNSPEQLCATQAFTTPSARLW